jgi:hypothetical protein
LLLISQDGGRCWEMWFVGESEVVALRWLFQRESENHRGLLAGLAVSGSFLQQFLNFLNPESLVVSAFLHFLFGDDFFHFKLLERDLGISFFHRFEFLLHCHFVGTTFPVTNFSRILKLSLISVVFPEDACQFTY